MMLFKLAFRNIVKSIKDYAIYFATLVLGVAVFYVFNALDSQTIMLNITNDTREIIDIIVEVMSVVSVFVSFVLGFLIVYASSFLMKRRKKEFGVYLLLGMGKMKVSTILCLETLIVGVISLATGLFVGMGASQGMSIIVATLFKADMTNFRFTVSTDAIVKTMVYFIVIFAVVIVFQTFVVGKNRLINLLQAGKKSQKNYAKNPVACVIVFAVGAILLGTAYYKVTVGFNDIGSLVGIGKEIVKGIIGNFAVFWSVSGLMVLLVKSNKKFYNKGLNAFTTKELSSRINTSVFAGGIISLLLFFTISILSCAVSVKNSMDIVIEKKTPMDIQFNITKNINVDGQHIEGESILEIFEETNVDMSQFKDVMSVECFHDNSVNLGTLTLENAYDVYYEPEYIWVSMMRVSDYNKVAAVYGLDTVELDAGEYMVVADYNQAIGLYNDAMKSGKNIEVNGKTYTPADKECRKGFVTMSASQDNNGILILPDGTDFSFVNYSEEYMFANYNVANQEEYNKLDEYFSEYGFDAEINTLYSDHTYVGYQTRNSIINASVGMTVLLVFVGLYLGIIFLISSGAILSLKVLSEAADSKDKYRILRKIGVDEKQIRRSLFSQCGLFFGLPLVLAIIHSIFGIQTALLIMEVFGREGLLASIIISACIILGIYGIYFAITYSCSKKIVSE
ncbi:MAG: FtsX-like permease family protein [Lachnospiraceae bacterium]|nr:FtsX-like permease family protein [Lachnospiraceae bacterium]